MNLGNLEQLAQWLEAGAPHVMFNMNVGRLRGDVALEEGLPHYNATTYNFTSGVGDCGTVCCIAGYAAHAASNFMPLSKEEEENWLETREKALEFLGLPRREPAPGSIRDFDGSDFFGHALFSNDEAPHDTTPQEAAIAVREVMAGNHDDPWRKVWEARYEREDA